MIKFPGIVDIEGLGQNEVNAESKSRLHDKKIKLASEKNVRKNNLCIHVVGQVASYAGLASFACC